MGLLDQLKHGEFTGLKRALGGGKHSTMGAGIGGGPGAQEGAVPGGPQRRAFGASKWDDEDGTGPINIGLRILQTFLPFINLCIYVAIASFQKKWAVGPSFLTALALFFNAQSLIHGGIFLATPLLADRLKLLRSVARLLRQVRVGVIINATQVVLMLLIALVTTVSAYTGGCKNPASDDHAELEGYTDAMGGFCRNKRAGAAFFWLNFLAWSATLGLILFTWYNIRKNPQSTGFVIPRSQFPTDDEEAFAHSDTEAPPHMGYRPSGDYYAGEGEGRLFAETAQGYGRGRVEEEEHYHPAAKDPFEDQPASGGAYGRDYEAADPYEAIRKSMDVQRPSY